MANDHQHEQGHDHGHLQAQVPQGARTDTDPVCGMTVEVNESTRHADYDGERLHFCSENCETKFAADPYFYASGNARNTQMVDETGTQWTCPMHPEILKDAPGACPICGMALEPIVPSDEPSEELTDFTRRMWISAAAAVPLIILTMGELVGLQLRDWIGHQTAIYIEFLLATPIILWAALPFFRRGVESIKNVSPNMWTLIALGVGAAYLYSLAATFLPGIFPDEYRTGESVGTYYETAVVIVHHQILSRRYRALGFIELNRKPRAALPHPAGLVTLPVANLCLTAQRQRWRRGVYPKGSAGTECLCEEKRVVCTLRGDERIGF